MRLKRLGFFRELEHGDQAGPSLVDLLGNEPREDETKIHDYLNNGLLFIGCPGLVEDVFDKTVGPIGSPSILTDGVWAWPDDLSYYVKKYHILLPVEFTDHARRNSFIIPHEDSVNISDLEL
jgi:hypothetical protein